jgi:microcystin-dependent protein
MSQNLPINFTISAFPIGFKGNCQDFANAIAERLTGNVQIGALFQAQYGGPQPTTDVGPWFKNGNSIYYFDYNTGQYQPAEDQFPIGGCMLWGGPGAPDRFLLCQGQGVSRTQYARLFQRVGTQWGAGDGANTFNLPPCGKYLIPAGYDGMSGNTYSNGTVGGAATFLLQPNQLPELYVLAHANNSVGQGNSSGGVGLTTDNAVSNWPVYSADGLPVTQRNGPIKINPPYQAMNLCIRYT